MKVLIVFYSRTGNTKKVAEEIANIVKTDSEEILDTKNRKGVFGFLISGRDAFLKRYTDIKKIKKDPLMYDLVIIGTPIWAVNISPPIRTYIHKYKNAFKNIAFFCTSGSGYHKYAAKVFIDMENLSNKKPIALLNISKREVNKKHFDKIKVFTKEIEKSYI